MGLHLCAMLCASTSLRKRGSRSQQQVLQEGENEMNLNTPLDPKPEPPSHLYYALATILGTLCCGVLGIPIAIMWIIDTTNYNGNMSRWQDRQFRRKGEI